MRLIAEFEKTGPAAYISHLDLQRVMGRALRRAQAPVRYSQGFNPHILMSFATALSVGCESVCEILDLPVEREDASFIDRMNATLPRGLSIQRMCVAQDDAPSPMAIVTTARYNVNLDMNPEAAIAFLSQTEIIVPKKGKKGVRDVDIRPMIYEYSFGKSDGGNALTMLLRHDNALSLNPALLLGAMGAPYGNLRRTALFAGNHNAYDLYGKGISQT